MATTANVVTSYGPASVAGSGLATVVAEGTKVVLSVQTPPETFRCEFGPRDAKRVAQELDALDRGRDGLELVGEGWKFSRSGTGLRLHRRKDGFTIVFPDEFGNARVLANSFAHAAHTAQKEVDAQFRATSEEAAAMRDETAKLLA